jgi:hypothetical protein
VWYLFLFLTYSAADAAKFPVLLVVSLCSEKMLKCGLFVPELFRSTAVGLEDFGSVKRVLVGADRSLFVRRDSKGNIACCLCNVEERQLSVKLLDSATGNCKTEDGSVVLSSRRFEVLNELLLFDDLLEELEKELVRDSALIPDLSIVVRERPLEEVHLTVPEELLAEPAFWAGTC